jgi:hypothetical protein
MAQTGYLRVKKFGVLSVAKIFAVFGAVIGIIALVISGALGLLGGIGGVAVGIGAGVLLLIVMTIGLFVGGSIEAFLYNVIANIVGPVKVTLNKKGVIGMVDPLSYAKIVFVFSLIVYGILAIFVSSLLLSVIGVSSAVGIGLSFPLVAAAFIFALLVYGFVLPVVWASVYNWLASKIGGVTIVLKKGRVESVDVMSYVKIAASLTTIIFVLERLIGVGVGLALHIPQTGGPLLLVASFVLVVIVAVVVAALMAFFYNIVAKKIGGIEVDVSK